MDDFIFGTLATDTLRRERVQGQRAGISHQFRRTPLDPLPGDPIDLQATAGPGYSVQHAFVYWSNDGSDPQGASGTAIHGFASEMLLSEVEWDTELWGYIRHYSAKLPAQANGTLLRYRISVITLDGTEIYADQGAYFALYIADDPAPEWSKQAIIYQIFVDRFNPGSGSDWLKPSSLDGFFGGTLRGITEKLDGIAELGFNTLWLTPIFPSPSHHGYDATDLFAIEPRLGTLADFQVLIEQAHQREIRVLLDFVPNHISKQHPAFQAAIQDPHSPYRNWFTFERWPDRYVTFFGVGSLPQLNLRDPAARQYVLDAAVFWLKLGVDGFRVDYAIGPSPDFWAAFRQVTHRTQPQSWTFGEIVDPPDEQLAFSGLLDGALDFMLLEALRQTFAFGRWDSGRLSAFLESHTAYFPQGFSRPSFLDNHDMNRFLWAAGNDERRLRLAALCQFTLSGPPVVYYGTEVALSQQRDVRQGGLGLPEESRLPMLWQGSQNRPLRAYYRQLIELRRQNGAFSNPIRRILLAEGTLLAYASGETDSEWLTVLNLGSGPASASFPGVAAGGYLCTDAGCSLSQNRETVDLTLSGFGGITFAWSGTENERGVDAESKTKKGQE